MSVRPLATRPLKPRRQLWDGLTISLAIAVVLLGLAIFFMPKPDSRTETAPKSSKQVPATMARVAAVSDGFSG
jgi:hypothetical protein